MRRQLIHTPTITTTTAIVPIRIIKLILSGSAEGGNVMGVGVGRGVRDGAGFGKTKGELEVAVIAAIGVAVTVG